jgi:hypothetical protein
LQVSATAGSEASRVTENKNASSLAARIGISVSWKTQVQQLQT